MRMKPLTRDIMRTSALVAAATGCVLLPLRLLHRTPAAAPKTEPRAVQTFAAPMKGDLQTFGLTVNEKNEVVGELSFFWQSSP